MCSPSFFLRHARSFRHPMRLSRYTTLLPSGRGDGSLILFSTRDAAAVLVPEHMIADIEQDRLCPEELQSLEQMGFVITDPERDTREVRGFIKELNRMATSLRIIVVLNLDCNLACTYCFEGSRKGKWYLSDEIEGQLVSFVKQRDLADKKSIIITFYGGEPLLSTERIVSLSEKIGAAAAERGLEYEFGMVTNGTLLKPDVVRKLVPLGFRNAKVTLDGPRDVHDRFRPFRTGAGSFDVIVRNIRDACDLIRIQIGGNYTQESYKDFPPLLDLLMAEGLTPDKIPVVKFDPVMRESAEFGAPDFHDGCASVNEPWISEATLFLREEILKRGYRTQKVMPSPCMIDMDDSFVVNYDGRLYKCPGLIGREQCCIGSLSSGVREYRAFHGLDSWKNEECLDCRYLPLCFGGCRYMLLLRSGSMQGLNCQKEYFDRTLGGLICQDIAYDL